MSRFFDGIDDRIDCGGRLPINALPTFPLTFTWWMKKQGYGAEDKVTFLPSRILSRETTFLVNGINLLRGWAIGLTKTGQIEYREHRRDENSSSDRVYTSPNVIPEDEWVFCALTVLPSFHATDIHFYTSTPADTTGVIEVAGGTRINGSGTLLHTTDVGMVIGASHHNNIIRSWYRGELADIRIFKAVLSIPDINRVRCDDELALNEVCHYRLTRAGTQETDVSGNGNGATIHGTTLTPPPPPVPCYGVDGVTVPPTEPDTDGSHEGGGVPTPPSIPDSEEQSNPGELGGEDLVAAASGHRARTIYWCIRARKPGHSSRHGGRYH